MCHRQLQDVCEIDSALAEMVQRARGAASGLASGTAPSIIDQSISDLKFAVQLATHEVVDLIPSGSQITVTSDTVSDWLALVEQRRLHEFDDQIAQIRMGIDDVIPLRALQLHTWADVQLFACGDPHIDIDVLKQHTTYHGFGAVRFF